MMHADQQKKAKKREIGVISPNCVGCRLCSLACSFLYTQAFSLSAARIQISPVQDSYDFMVSFTEDCIQCGECAKYCYNNVLRFSKDKGENHD
jgi:NAD-dependent dihydropyrimidine dehydrogenase PreA subunit